MLRCVPSILDISSGSFSATFSLMPCRKKLQCISLELHVRRSKFWQEKLGIPSLEGADMNIKNGKFGSGVPDANWRLNEGVGDWVFTQHIDFGEDLPEAPAVVLGITELESTFDPVRVAVEAKNVNLRGFDAEIRTWSDTHILSCSGYWLASTSWRRLEAKIDCSKSALRDRRRQ